MSDVCVSKNKAPNLQVYNITFNANSTIARFSQVDETLYRGSRPEPSQLQELKDIGITTIIDFTTEKFKQENYCEAEQAKIMGIKHFKIPCVSFENPSDEDVNKFFCIIEQAKMNHEKVFIHCLEGRDRTGLFTELYKIKFGLSDAQTSINNLIKNRYNFTENPLAVYFIKQFANTAKKV
ncbi:MAG: dual specificity protein phosphatase family protein [bacterium]|nr:dual specificity protein phosphatase family protein [bacterium]